MQSEYDDEQEGEEDLGNEKTAKQMARQQSELDEHRLIQGNTPINRAYYIFDSSQPSLTFQYETINKKVLR